MKTTGRNHSRSVALRLLMTGLLGACLGMVTVRAGDVTANNVTVYKDLKVLDGTAISAPTNGLVLHYSFSTNTAPVPDDSGTGKTGTVVGATWVTNGITGGAYSFDGNDYVAITGYKGIAGNNTTSVSYWLRTTSSSATVTLMWGSDAVAKGSFICYFDSNGYQFGMSVNPPPTIPLASINDGVWHFITSVYDPAAGQKLYLDGTLKDSNSVTNMNVLSIYDVKIGSYTNASSYFLNGAMDEVRIYNRVLSAEEVQGLYLHDAHLTAGSATFETGVKYVKPLGDLSMGVYTNNP